LIGWGAQVHVLCQVAEEAKEKMNISCEVIDMMTLLPYDLETIVQSVKKTGRVLISHEAPITNGLGAELAAALLVS
jgi:2-oxoisovalerate dehydrogenase E1 component beta subunit